MINYYEKVDFRRTVWTVDTLDPDCGIIESDLGELVTEYADTTTTPMGVGTRIYTDGCDLRSWGHGGNNDALVYEFENEEQAEHALLLCHLYDVDNSPHVPDVFYTRVEAETFLAELLEDAE